MRLAGQDLVRAHGDRFQMLMMAIAKRRPPPRPSTYGSSPHAVGYFLSADDRHRFGEGERRLTCLLEEAGCLPPGGEHIETPLVFSARSGITTAHAGHNAHPMIEEARILVSASRGLRRSLVPNVVLQG